MKKNDKDHVGHSKFHFFGGSGCQDENQNGRACRVEEGGLMPKIVDATYSTGTESALSNKRPLTDITDERIQNE